MATTQKILDAVEKTRAAIDGVERCLLPVLRRLNEGGFEKSKPEAEATAALSIGMVRYMGARLRGLDQGRKPDDALRKELNNMKKVLAEIKKKHGGSDSATKERQAAKPTMRAAVEGSTEEEKRSDDSMPGRTDSSKRESADRDDSTKKKKRKKS